MLNVNRRDFLAGLGVAAVAGKSALGATAPVKRPNVLFLISDQISNDAISSTVGDKWVKTPNIDKLRARGMYFTRAYVSNPLCVPSRTAMFTGRYPVETGIQTNDKVLIDAKRYKCLGTIFREAGYSTGYFGKWHIMLPETEKAVEQHGFEHMASEVVDVETAAHVCEYMSEKRDGPFFAVASFLNPHNICEWARGQYGKMDQGAIPEAPAAELCPPLRANHGIMKDEPEIMGVMRQAYHNSPLFPVGGFDDAKWRQYRWAYYRLVERVDGLIGKVLDHLKEAGLEEDTLVVFTGDHGDCQGAHFFNQKTVLFEEAQRVPFVVAYPRRVKAGESAMLMNTGVDLVPTLCGFAGIEVDKTLHGESLLPVATGRVRRGERKYVVTSNHMVQGGPVDGKDYRPEGRALRTERYKYTVYSEGKSREALVDLEADAGEMVNLAGDSRYGTVLNEHRRLLAEWGAGVKDGFPYVRNT